MGNMHRLPMPAKEGTKEGSQATYQAVSLATFIDTLPRPHTKAIAQAVRRITAARKAKERAITFNPEWTPEPSYGRSRDRYRWVEYPANGLRFVGAVHEIRGSGDGNIPYFDRSLVNHTGWYVDNWQDETVHGEVYQLPARDGKPYYVPAVNDPNNEAAVIDFHSGTDDLYDAIRWADSMAESYAEREREYQAKEDAKVRLEDISEEIVTAYRDLRELCIEIRANCDKLTGLDKLRGLIRAEVNRVRRSVRKLRAEARKIENEGLTY